VHPAGRAHPPQRPLPHRSLPGGPGLLGHRARSTCRASTTPHERASPGYYGVALNPGARGHQRRADGDASRGRSRASAPPPRGLRASDQQRRQRWPTGDAQWLGIPPAARCPACPRAAASATKGNSYKVYFVARTSAPVRGVRDVAIAGPPARFEPWRPTTPTTRRTTSRSRRAAVAAGQPEQHGTGRFVRDLRRVAPTGVTMRVGCLVHER